ncbi:MAG: histidinol-phosphate transaminase [Pseudomonadota bacterium]|nr:histidinol-phosphate transaminase [Pseudomonadota bacterium]
MKSLMPRPGIMEIKPYTPGKSNLPGLQNIIKLSSNESALGPSQKAIDAFIKASNDLHLYPDGEVVGLRKAIGDVYGVDPARLVCGAGSDELFYNLARAYAGPGDEILYSKHGFNIYPIVAHAVGATPVTAPEKELVFDVDAVLGAVTDRTRIVFIANPNNPTGSYISREELTRLRNGLPEKILLVIDGAYSEYVRKSDYTDGIDLVTDSQNTVMTRTFSKIYGLASLRVGWAFCPGEIAGVLNRLRAPFNITSAAQAAAIEAVNDQEHINASLAHNDTWLPWLQDKLSSLGLHVHPSVGNFLLVRFPESPGSTADEANKFLASRGIIPRETSGYGLPQCLRITIGKEYENRAVEKALSEFVSLWKK